MSEQSKSKITVGDFIDGEVKGTVNNRNKFKVEQDDRFDYAVGNKIKGNVAENAKISNDNVYDMLVSHAQQESGPSMGLQTTKSYRHIGNRTFINQDKSMVFTNLGAVTCAGQVGGNISYKLNHLGSPQEIDEQSVVADPNAKHISNVGGVVVVGNVDGAINHESNVELQYVYNKELDRNERTIKGHVLIFNQEFKTIKQMYRKGSKRDVESLCKTIKKFGIDPSVKPDMNLEEIENEITQLSNTDFTDYKLFVCIFMSHCKPGGFVEANDKKFNLKETIINPILRTTSLNGITKILITVASRSNDDLDLVENEDIIVSESDDIDYSTCMISYSTYQGHLDGTNFIQSLCEQIDADVRNDTSIQSIFKKVNEDLAEMLKRAPIFKTSMDDISFGDLM